MEKAFGAGSEEAAAKAVYLALAAFAAKLPELFMYVRGCSAIVTMVARFTVVITIAISTARCALARS
jgi:hypothetical protein